MVYYRNCFCCKSRIGAKILAILGFIFSSLVFFTIVVGYGLLYGELHGLRTRNQFGPLVQEIVTLLDGYIDAVFAIIFVFCLFWITSCILLLLGINMKQKNFFLPWLILHMIGFIVSKNLKFLELMKNRFFQLYAIGILAHVITSIPYIPYVPIILVAYFINGLILAFLFYCWDVVYSVYSDVKKEEVNSELPMKITCSF